jgi:hypothetical protein
VPLPRYWPHAFIAAFRAEAGAFCSALRIPPDPSDPAEPGTFTPWERRHEANCEDAPSLGDAAADVPPPDELQAVTAASNSAALPAIRPACRLLMVGSSRAGPRSRTPRLAPA